MYIDIHAHLEMCHGKIEDIVKRAKKAGVGIIVNNSVNKESNRKTLEMSEKFAEIKAALGYYPCEVIELAEDEFESEIDFIKKNKEKIVAIGEVGLDLKECSELEKQKKRFEKFIELAKELNVPLIIHSRKAEAEVIDILEKNKFKRAIMHCFSGNFKLVRRIIDNGWTFSIPANIKNSSHFQKLVEVTPIDQLLCETDSPYLHPDKERDNEPMNVVESYKKIAEIKKLELKRVENILEDNYKELFLR